jgi:hypothetical protein
MFLLQKTINISIEKRRKTLFLPTKMEVICQIQLRKLNV